MPTRPIQFTRADRSRFAVLVDLPRRRHAPHRGALGRAAAQGHEPQHPRALRPRRRASLGALHRGARPQRLEPPANFVSLGRTFGMPANGAVSNLTGPPHRVLAMRRELRDGGYDVAHIHEPIVPMIGWDALMSSGELPLVGTFHTYSDNALSNGIGAVVFGGRRRMNRLHARIAVSEAAAWTARRFYGGRYRIVPNGVPWSRRPRPSAVSGAGQRRRLTTRAFADDEHGSATHPLHRPSRRAQGPARACCAPSRPCASRCPPRSRSSAARPPRSRRCCSTTVACVRSGRSPRSASGRAEPSRGPVCAIAARRELRHGAHRGVRRLHARRRI